MRKRENSASSLWVSLERWLGTNMITIRRCQPDEAQALWAVHFSAIHQVAAADYIRELPHA